MISPSWWLYKNTTRFQII